MNGAHYQWELCLRTLISGDIMTATLVYNVFSIGAEPIHLWLIIAENAKKRSALKSIYEMGLK